MEDIKEDIKEDFLEQTKAHTMEVLLDNGYYRHLKFTNNGSNIYRYDLITYPGGLVIRGDMGTYVFERLPDMFEFFRSEGKLTINPGYWGEKLQTDERRSGYLQWSEKEAIESVYKYIDQFIESEDENWPQEIVDMLKKDVQSLDLSGQWIAASELEHYNFFESDESNEFYEFTFDVYDFFDGSSNEEYSFHYIWCLWAIVYGILQYDNRIVQ